MPPPSSFENVIESKATNKSDRQKLVGTDNIMVVPRGKGARVEVERGKRGKCDRRLDLASCSAVYR